MKPAHLIALALGLGGLIGLPANAAEVYKWVDENGGVHYSEAPPPADAKTKSSVRVNTRLPEGAAEAQEQRAKAQADADKAEKDAADKAKKDAADKGKKDKKDKDAKAIAQAKEANKANCPQWRTDLATMGQHGRVRSTDESGNITVMSEEDRQQRIDDTQKNIDTYCN